MTYISQVTVGLPIQNTSSSKCQHTVANVGFVLTYLKRRLNDALTVKKIHRTSWQCLVIFNKRCCTYMNKQVIFVKIIT